MGRSKNAPIQTIISDKPAELPKPPKELKEDKRRGVRKTNTNSAASKIVIKTTLQEKSADEKDTQKPNIILHLKCHLKDLTEQENIIHNDYKYNPDVPPEIVAYDKSEKSYVFLSTNDTQQTSNAVGTNVSFVKNEENSTGKQLADSSVYSCQNDGFLKSVSDFSIHSTNPDVLAAQNNTHITNDTEINTKLKKLKLALFKNLLDEKKSACFWCSYDFENPTCYIPKYQLDNTIHAYGSFCSPECATGFLFKEDIDDSVKFERFHLLNQIYGEIFNYEKNIKPAPSPHYMLSKYYGNLTIEEYRALSRSDKTFLVVETPMTRILPELHEEKDNAVCSGVYRVKRQCDVVANKQSKNAILKEAFGLL